MIVVDTNVIAFLFIKGDHTQKAKALLNYDPEWVTSIIWRSEFRNIIAFYLRQGFVTLDEAGALIEQAEALMHGNEYEVRHRDVMKLVTMSTCSAYDCEFVALAQFLNLRLFTTDERILSEFPDVSHSLNSFKKNLIVE